MQNQMPPLPGAEYRHAAELITGVRMGDAECLNELLSLIYPELRRRARWMMGGERAGHTFGVSGSELVQRTMEKILASGGQLFSAAAAEEDLIRMLTLRMRHILVDYARTVKAQKHAGPGRRVDFQDAQRKAATFTVKVDEVLSTDAMLTRLAEQDSEAAKALELRFFAGFTNEEAAAAMGLSEATFRRLLKKATDFVKSLSRNASAQGRA